MTRICSSNITHVSETHLDDISDESELTVIEQMWT